MGQLRRRPLRQSPASPAPNAGAEPSSSARPEYLLVGRIVRPHGVRGEVLMRVITDYPEHLFGVETLYLGDRHTPYRVRSVRSHNHGLLITFDVLGDRSDAEAMRATDVFIHITDAVPLEQGEYYLFELEGISVVSEDGQPVGRLTGFLETGANDVYIVTTTGGTELLLPVIPSVILDVNIAERVMTVHLLDGLV